MPITRPTTVILSDLHLTEAQPEDPKRPLWKRFKRRDLFMDDQIAALLAKLRGGVTEPLELVLNGDIFDFDAVCAVPHPAPFALSWLEKRRGLAPEQPKSAFKMQVILSDHPLFVAALRDWVRAGHQVVLIIGNHDLELHWPAVRRVLMDALALPAALAAAVRFCEICYLSGGDTLITHGNQYDRYCVCQDPIHPTIDIGGRPRIRIPFGDVAGKLMLNGMGLFNPYVESSFIKPLREYLVFFYRYIARYQPLILLSWLWTAVATLIVTVREGLEPPLRDPLTVEPRMEAVAARAQTPAHVIRTLQAIDVHSAVFNPYMVARELWLDRALLLLLVAGGSFQIFSTLNVFVSVSAGWALVFFAILLPPLIFYSRSIESDTMKLERGITDRIPLIARVSGVRRVIMGHTHIERHTMVGSVEYLNTGTWSSAYNDLDCTQPFGRKCFALIRPGPVEREARLCEWKEGEVRMLEATPPEVPPSRKRRLRARIRSL